MRLLINIPKEFEQHFQADRFEDSLHRLSADVHLLAGNYEKETAAMLIESFKNAIPIPRGRLFDADALKKVIANEKHMDADIFNGGNKMNYEEVNEVMRKIRQAEEEFNKKVAEALNLVISTADKQIEPEDKCTKNFQDDNYIRGINDLRAACLTFDSTSTIAGRRSYLDVKTYFRRYGVEIGPSASFYDILHLCDGPTFIKVVNELNC